MPLKKQISKLAALNGSMRLAFPLTQMAEWLIRDCEESLKQGCIERGAAPHSGLNNGDWTSLLHRSNTEAGRCEPGALKGSWEWSHASTSYIVCCFSGLAGWRKKRAAAQYIIFPLQRGVGIKKTKNAIIFISFFFFFFIGHQNLVAPPAQNTIHGCLFFI